MTKYLDDHLLFLSETFHVILPNQSIKLLLKLKFLFQQKFRFEQFLFERRSSDHQQLFLLHKKLNLSMLADEVADDWSFKTNVDSRWSNAADRTAKANESNQNSITDDRAA